MMTVVLPYPPSVNRYYRHVGAKVLISREGREYRAKVVGLARAGRVAKFTADVAVCARVYPPDKRRRDADNVLKALLDALVHGGVLADDSLVKDLRVRMMPPRPDSPRVEVSIEELGHDRED